MSILMISARGAQVLAFVVLPVIAGSVAGAQDFPVKPIRLVVPFAAGGGNDISARTLADALRKSLDKTVVVDNRPGAGSIIGTEIVSKSNPDGHTLLLGNISMAFNAALYKKLPYDTLRDFTPISLVVTQPNMLVTHPSRPAKSYREFIALARSQPDKLTYASTGIGTGGHLAVELLSMAEKIKLVHVTYKGTGPAVIAMLGDEIAVFFSSFATALPHVRDGRLRGYAVSSAKRARTLPDVPTIAESGLHGYEYITWYGLLSPAGVPPAVVAKLNKEVVAALNSPEVQQRYLSLGMEPNPSTSAQYAVHLKAETEKWTKVVRAAKISSQ